MKTIYKHQINEEITATPYPNRPDLLLIKLYINTELTSRFVVYKEDLETIDKYLGIHQYFKSHWDWLGFCDATEDQDLKDKVLRAYRRQYYPMSEALQRAIEEQRVFGDPYMTEEERAEHYLNTEGWNDLSNMCRVQSYDHTIWMVDAKAPLSVPGRVYYINGVTSNNFHIDKALKILKASPYVTDIVRESIPYYNQKTSSGDESVEFTVHLPQDLLDECYSASVDESGYADQDEWYGSFIAYGDIDPLGLKAALRDKPLDYRDYDDDHEDYSY